MEKLRKRSKNPSEKKRLSKGAIVLIAGIAIIAVPVIIFGLIILTAALQTGHPVLGSRFDNDLKPSISANQTKTIETSVSSLSEVDKCSVVMESAQYRVNVDTNDSLSSDQIRNLAIDIYNKVNDTLPVGTYFTATDTMKMYDLAINVYNYIDEDNDNMIYYILTKNSKMDNYSLQCVSEPVDEDLAKELRGEIDLTTGAGDVNIEEEETGVQ